MSGSLPAAKPSRYVTSHPSQLNLAIPPWLRAMTPGHHHHHIIINVSMLKHCHFGECSPGGKEGLELNAMWCANWQRLGASQILL